MPPSASWPRNRGLKKSLVSKAFLKKSDNSEAGNGFDGFTVSEFFLKNIEIVKPANQLPNSLFLNFFKKNLKK